MTPQDPTDRDFSNPDPNDFQFVPKEEPVGIAKDLDESFNKYQQLDPKKKKKGARWAILFFVGIGMWVVNYYLQYNLLLFHNGYWVLTGISFAIVTFALLARARFNLTNLPYFSKETAFKKAFNENGKLRIGPKIGISLTMVFFNLVCLTWIIPFLIFILSMIPVSELKKVEVENLYVEEAYGIWGDYTVCYFKLDGEIHEYLISHPTSYYNDKDFIIHYHEGLLGIKWVKTFRADYR